MELHSSDSVLEMVIKEEEQKAIDREIRLAYAVAHRVLPKARPRKGSSIWLVRTANECNYSLSS